MTPPTAGICAYCGQAVLTGREEPEHAVPRAVNGRFTVQTVCDPCNRDVGKRVDQPWLNEPLVLDARFAHQIPDRYGNVVTASPLLTGFTDDGRRVTLGPDGNPRLLNSPARLNEDGTTTITAADEDALDKAIKREQRKAARDGKTWTGDSSPENVSDQPQITGTSKMRPGVWEQESAKVLLALLSDLKPESWRLGPSANQLREILNGPPRPVGNVRLTDAESVRAWGPEPATVAIVKTVRGVTIGQVAMLGALLVRFILADDADDLDHAWVSDPVRPERSMQGRWDHMLHNRQVATGQIDGEYI